MTIVINQQKEGLAMAGLAGRKPTIERKQGDLVKTPTRLPETMRDELKAAALESGRSMNAEIIHRLEEYERVSQSYALLSEFPEVRRACQVVVAIGDEVSRVFSEKGKGEETKEEMLSRCIGNYYPFSITDQKNAGVAYSIAHTVRDKFDPPENIAMRAMDIFDAIFKIWSDENHETYTEADAPTLVRDLHLEMMHKQMETARRAMEAARSKLPAVEGRFALLNNGNPLPPHMTPGERGEILMKDHEAKLEKHREDQREKITASKAEIDRAVAAGEITEDQAESLKETLEGAILGETHLR